MMPEFNVAIQIDDAYASKVDSLSIQQAVNTTVQLHSHRVSDGSVAVTITDNQTVAHLNAEYRGVDAPTDVLSFENVPDFDFPSLDPAMTNFLGDIVIAFPVAQAQAEARGHSPQEELILLTVHGMLHLFGFDHDTDTRRSKMWMAQHEVMSRLGLNHVQPTED